MLLEGTISAEWRIAPSALECWPRAFEKLVRIICSETLFCKYKIKMAFGWSFIADKAPLLLGRKEEMF